MNMDSPAKSSADGGCAKKLKDFDGLAISIGNGNGNSTEHGSDHKLSDRFVEILRSSLACMLSII